VTKDICGPTLCSKVTSLGNVATLGVNGAEEAWARRCGVLAAGHALVLASTAQPSTADTVLAVEGHLDAGHTDGVAGTATVPINGTGCESQVVDRGQAGKLEPAHGLGDGNGSCAAVAIDAPHLLVGVSRFMTGLSERGPEIVLAHELVGPVTAVLNTVASLGVGHNLIASADESVAQAGPSDVVALGEGLGLEWEAGVDSFGQDELGFVEATWMSSSVWSHILEGGCEAEEAKEEGESYWAIRWHSGVALVGVSVHHLLNRPRECLRQ